MEYIVYYVCIASGQFHFNSNGGYFLWKKNIFIANIYTRAQPKEWTLASNIQQSYLVKYSHIVLAWQSVHKYMMNGLHEHAFNCTCLGRIIMSGLSHLFIIGMLVFLSVVNVYNEVTITK